MKGANRRFITAALMVAAAIPQRVTSQTRTSSTSDVITTRTTSDASSTTTTRIARAEPTLTIDQIRDRLGLAGVNLTGPWKVSAANGRATRASVTFDYAVSVMPYGDNTYPIGFAELQRGVGQAVLTITAVGPEKLVATCTVEGGSYLIKTGSSQSTASGPNLVMMFDASGPGTASFKISRTDSPWSFYNCDVYKLQ